MKSKLETVGGVSDVAGVAAADPPLESAGTELEFPQPRSPRYETLTFWRGVACLMVVTYHSVFTGYGLAFPAGFGPLEDVLSVVYRFWLGVPLFFVISGYCVTASADAARRRSGPVRNFFWRRFRRIFPVYWAWLGLAAIVIWLGERMFPGFFTAAFIPDPQALTLGQWLGNISLTETWRWHVTGGMENALVSPMWTLCYEEQFYGLVGLALVFSRRYFFVTLALVSFGVIAGLFVFPSLGIGTMGTFLDGKWLMFAAGVLVYYTVNYAPARAGTLACIVLGFAALCAAAQPGHLLLRKVNEPNQSFFCAFRFALLLIPLHQWDKHVCGARILRPLAFCGEMCYSLYLVHWPVVTLLSWAFSRLGLSNPFVVFFLGISCCLVVAIALACFFHHFVERRFWNPRYPSQKVD